MTILCVGLVERRVQQRLLAEGDLTLDKALKIAQAMELAEQDVRDLQQAVAHSRAGVLGLAQSLVTPRQDKGTKLCYRCGGSTAFMMQGAMYVGRRVILRRHVDARTRFPVPW